MGGRARSSSGPSLLVVELLALLVLLLIIPPRKVLSQNKHTQRCTQAAGGAKPTACCCSFVRSLVLGWLAHRERRGPLVQPVATVCSAEDGCEPRAEVAGEQDRLAAGGAACRAPQVERSAASDAWSHHPPWPWPWPWPPCAGELCVRARDRVMSARAVMGARHPPTTVLVLVLCPIHHKPTRPIPLHSSQTTTTILLLLLLLSNTNAA